MTLPQNLAAKEATNKWAEKERPIDQHMLDLYSDYLITSFSYTTATDLSRVLDQGVSHDKVTRFLSERSYTSKDLWHLVKPAVREVEAHDGIVIFDDTVEEKEYTDENDIIAWHFDHTKGRSVKGVNILNCLYQKDETTLPLAFEIVKKAISFTDAKTGKRKRRSTMTKNEMLRSMLDIVLRNQVKFAHVLADTWFSSNETMEYIVEKQKHFVFAVKENRLVALSEEEKQKGDFKNLGSLTFGENEVVRCFFKGMDMPVSLVKQVFANKDDSVGVLYLATDDREIDFASLTTIYHKRWKVEEFHKSIKSNTGLSKSPTKTATTQSNHFFASIYSYFKLELLSIKTKLNHFALKSKLYLKALLASFKELQELREGAACA